MSESAFSPRPGSAAAFKQRHEAYALAREMPEAVKEARSEITSPSSAEAYLGWVVQGVERNPVAQAMIAERHPSMLGEAQSLYKAVAEEARSEPRIVAPGEWRSSAGVETRVDIGQSEQGFHYQLQVASVGYERDTGWSKPLPSAEAALRAGHAQEDRAHGYDPKQTPVTPRSLHAEKLRFATQYRRSAAGREDGDKARAACISAVRELIAEAREARTSRPHHHAEVSAPARGPAQAQETQRSRGMER